MREWRIIEALDGTDVPHTEAIAVCTDQSVLGRTFYLMGFVDGWSPMSTRRALAGAVRHRPGRAPRASPSSSSRASPCSRQVDWRAKGLADLGRPDGFHERQVDRWTAFLERIKGRELPGFDEAAAWLRAHRPIDYIPGLMHGDYQFANVMFKHGAPARLAAIVDWEMGTVGDPKLDLGWVVQSWPEDTSGRRGPDRRLRRHDGHAVAGRGARALRRRRRAARSTTSTTTACSPSGSWPSSSSRATSGPATTRSSRRSAPSCSTSCRRRRELAGDDRLRRASRRRASREQARAPAGAPLTRHARRGGPTHGPPEVVELADVPAPALGAGQVRVRVHVGAVNFPDVLRRREHLPGVGADARSSRAASSPAWSPRSDRGGDGVAVGDRVFGSTLVGAFAEEVVVAGHFAHARSRPGWTTRWRRRSAWPTAPRTTCCARWRPCSRARSWSCSEPAAAWAPRPSSSARCWAPR